jgi:branched-subunit amino acid ABC-type transport system permease component/ABC-type transport system involved in cytochrome c biogenesis ATPase subunit
MNAELLLRATGLTKKYGGSFALSDADLTLQAGEVRALVGANGAGKSTLIKILTGAVRPDAGQTEIRGSVVEPESPARMIAAGVACIYQHANLVPAMTVLDNIYLGRQPAGAFGLVKHREQRARARALLDQYDIDLPLEDLPTVKQKEVEIAKALSLFVARLQLPPIVVTLASLSIVRGGALMMAGPDLHLIRGPGAFLFIGSGTFAGLPFSVLLFLIAGAFFTFLQYRTRFGLCVTAIGDNERAANLSGVPVWKVKASAYVLCSSCAGLAGIVQSSQVHTATATYGMGVELDVIAAVVLGGTSLAGGSGSIPLTIAGVMLIGVIDNGLGLLNVPIEMQLIAKGTIIVGALATTNRKLLSER